VIRELEIRLTVEQVEPVTIIEPEQVYIVLANQR